MSELNVAALRAALLEAELPVVPTDDLYLSTAEGIGLRDTFEVAEADGTTSDTDTAEDDLPFFEVGLHLVEGEDAADRSDIKAVVAIPLWGCEENDLVKISAWLRHEAIPHAIGEDDDYAPWLLLVEYMEGAELHRASQWVADLLRATKELFGELDQATAGPDPDLVALQPIIDLRREGRLDDAITAAESLLAETGPTLTSRARGWALFWLGALHLVMDHIQDGTRDTCAAMDLLAAAGDVVGAARADLNLVIADLGHGRLDTALERCDRVGEVIDQIGNQHDRDSVTHYRATALANHGRHSDALALIQPLEQRLSQEDESSPLLDEVRLTRGAIEGNIGPSDPEVGPAANPLTDIRSKDPMDQARALAERAALRAMSAMHAMTNPEDADLTPATSAAKHAEEALKLAAAARDKLPQGLPQDMDDDLTQAELVARALVSKDAEPTETVRRLATRAGDQRTPAAVRLLSNAGWFAQRTSKMDDALSAYTDALALAEDLDLHGLAARLHINIVIARLQAGAGADGTVRPEVPVDRDTMRGLQRHVLAALRAWDEQDLRFPSPEQRSRLASERDRLLTVATLIMSSAGNHRYAARLIELARAQGIPEHEATGLDGPLLPSMPAPLDEEQPSPTRRSPTQTDPEAGTDPDANVQQVRASLGDLAVTSATPDDPLTATAAVGGPGAWRWLLRRAPGMILWAVVKPDGQAYSGVLTTRAPWGLNPAAADLQFPEPDAKSVSSALEEFRQAVRPDIENYRTRMDTIQNRLLVEDPGNAEPEWAWEAGRQLVPEVLAQELRQRLEPGSRPLPLVIAPSSGLSGLPYALLGLEAPRPEAQGVEARHGRRLVEAAVISIAPPSGGLAERVADRVADRSEQTSPLPVRMAIVNPTGPTPELPKDLTHINDFLKDHRDFFDADDSVVYAGPTAREVLGAHACEPTLAAVLTTLTDQPAGTLGVFAIAAHVAPAPDKLPLGGGIPLRSMSRTDRERLAVAHLLQPGINPPSRALLHGCSSLGIDTDLNEWWGLPIALLHAGSTGVLAAAWDLLDSRGAVDVSGELLEAARTAPDLAVALRDIQLRHLRAWREQREGDRRFVGDQENHHPHLWAGWTYVGAHRG